jgi:hypothetical protein
MPAPQVIHMDARLRPVAGKVRVSYSQDLEDARLGAAVLERIRSGKERSYSLEEVVAELGLDPSDL